MRNLRLLIIAILAIIAAGCSTVPFTQQLRDKHNFSDEAVAHLQYYISGPILLQRVMKKGEVSVTPGHHIRILKDRKIEEVKFPSKTPGLAMVVNPKSLEVNFEEGKENLKFSSDDANRIPRHGLYKLDHEGTLVYAKKEFKIVKGQDVYLLVDLKEVDKYKKDTHVVPGRRFAPK